MIVTARKAEIIMIVWLLPKVKISHVYGTCPSFCPGEVIVFSVFSLPWFPP